MFRKPALGTLVRVLCDSPTYKLLVEVTRRFALAAVYPFEGWARSGVTLARAKLGRCKQSASASTRKATSVVIKQCPRSSRHGGSLYEGLGGSDEPHTIRHVERVKRPHRFLPLLIVCGNYNVPSIKSGPNLLGSREPTMSRDGGTHATEAQILQSDH